MGSVVDIPSSFTAGTTFRVASPDNITLYLRGSVSRTLTSCDGHLKVTAAETAQWAPGTYFYSVRKKEENGDISEISSGSIEIFPDIAALPEGTDARSQTRRTYDAICAVIEKRASLDQQEYRINNRELKRTPLADLLKLRSTYASLLSREGRRKPIRTYNVRF